ncbi:hypothetical protein PGQ11_008017 [Apiospora arundinis]|uniref:C2H2-type domain-containing protein n=1 Tax=Apiospora arundinis TaxID=335852 RepID=A0ABR2IDM4_9PEZI
MHNGDQLGTHLHSKKNAAADPSNRQDCKYCSEATNLIPKCLRVHEALSHPEKVNGNLRCMYGCGYWNSRPDHVKDHNRTDHYACKYCEQGPVYYTQSKVNHLVKHAKLDHADQFLGLSDADIKNKIERTWTIQPDECKERIRHLLEQVRLQSTLDPESERISEFPRRSIGDQLLRETNAAVSVEWFQRQPGSAPPLGISPGGHREMQDDDSETKPGLSSRSGRISTDNIQDSGSQKRKAWHDEGHEGDTEAVAKKSMRSRSTDQAGHGTASAESGAVVSEEDYLVQASEIDILKRQNSALEAKMVAQEAKHGLETTQLRAQLDSCEVTIQALKDEAKSADKAKEKEMGKRDGQIASLKKRITSLETQLSLSGETVESLQQAVESYKELEKMKRG